MSLLRRPHALAGLALSTLVALVAVTPALAHDPPFTDDLGREHCTFSAYGNHHYFPLWPGHSLLLEGEEEDDGELVELAVRITNLADTERVDGVETRVVEEREWEDGELVEVSRNFLATCRETGAVWYFGEDVDDYEDGEIVGHGGAWRAGTNGARPGILMPGNPLIGARYQQELAPGVAEDRGEIVGFEGQIVTPAGTFHDVLVVHDTDALDPESAEEPDVKRYAHGVGQVQDEGLLLTAIDLPACLPDASTSCLADGRFAVTVERATAELPLGPAVGMQISNDAAEYWFFSPDNTELLVKVLDACDEPGFGTFWVFAAGLTNVELVITVTDTATGMSRTYTNDLGTPFAPVLDTSAFATCP